MNQQLRILRHYKDPLSPTKYTSYRPVQHCVIDVGSLVIDKRAANLKLQPAITVGNWDILNLSVDLAIHLVRRPHLVRHLFILSVHLVRPTVVQLILHQLITTVRSIVLHARIHMTLKRLMNASSKGLIPKNTLYSTYHQKFVGHPC